MKTFVSIILLALSVAFCSPAVAESTNMTNNSMIQNLNWTVYNWWSYTYGITSCHPSHRTVYVADSLPGNAGEYATTPGCEIWNRAQGWPIDTWIADGRRDLCEFMVHGEGHNAGLGHTYGWVMDPRGPDYQPTPGICNNFAWNR